MFTLNSYTLATRFRSCFTRGTRGVMHKSYQNNNIIKSLFGFFFFFSYGKINHRGCGQYTRSQLTPAVPAVNTISNDSRAARFSILSRFRPGNNDRNALPPVTSVHAINARASKTIRIFASTQRNISSVHCRVLIIERSVSTPYHDRTTTDVFVMPFLDRTKANLYYYT